MLKTISTSGRHMSPVRYPLWILRTLTMIYEHHKKEGRKGDHIFLLEGKLRVAWIHLSSLWRKQKTRWVTPPCLKMDWIKPRVCSNRQLARSLPLIFILFPFSPFPNRWKFQLDSKHVCGISIWLTSSKSRLISACKLLASLFLFSRPWSTQARVCPAGKHSHCEGSGPLRLTQR